MSSAGDDLDQPVLPSHWPATVQTAFLHVIALAQHALLHARTWVGDNDGAALARAARRDQAEQEPLLQREEMRIKDARMDRIPAHERPHYLPEERLAILELRAARGWSLAQTARRFLVTTNTIASWTKRLDEQGPEALLQTPQPVNKYPDLVRYIVQRLQTLCPTLGKVKIAQILARAGVHLAATTVGRMRRQPPTRPPEPGSPPRPEPAPSAKRVTAKRPNHVWHVDLSTVSTGGFWVPWFPASLLQSWPCCWWLAVVVDHFSRRIMGITVFWRQPTSVQVRQFLGQVIARVAAAHRGT